jgi:hypothetical protein
MNPPIWFIDKLTKTDFAFSKIVNGDKSRVQQLHYNVDLNATFTSELIRSMYHFSYNFIIIAIICQAIFATLKKKFHLRVRRDASA